MFFSSKRIFLSLAVALSFAAPAFPAEPTETQLSANVMDYDTVSGEFKVQGNVTLKRLDITITSEFGQANSKTEKARMWSKVKGWGTHQGEKLDFTCDRLESDFSVAEGDYTMTGSVDAVFGTRRLISELARLKGPNFYAAPVTRFEDSQRKLFLVCQKMQGDYDAQGLHHFVGTGDVYIHQINGQNDVTEIWSNRLVYNREKDSLTATGNARALQKGRRITARNLIYYPSTGKLEAQGSPRITVDVSKGKNAPAGNSAQKGKRQGAWVKGSQNAGSKKP